MANRALLHVDKLPEFRAWLTDRGYELEDPKGTYEVLRVRYPGYPPVIFYQRDRATVHITTYGHGEKLAWAFIRERRRNAA